ncbi:MAG TPA: HDOD domain-containing protein [Rhodocyclaceae bacterium]|nr:HDOD domain-containing protein [Rhodocyclaceae bacterium]
MENARYAFAWQPVLNGAGATVAIELLYSPHPLGETGLPDGEAEGAANAVLSAFVHSGLDDLLRMRRAFLPVTAALLDSELLNLLPPDRFALEVTVPLVRTMNDRCRELKARGYRFVLDATDTAELRNSDSLGSAVLLADVLKLAAGQVLSGQNDSLIDEAWAQGVQLYTCGVDRPEDFTALDERGFHLFQGYHFAHPVQVEGQRADPQKLAVLDLLAKLLADEDDRALEEAMKADPVLSVHLLRLVNSSAFAMPTPIRSLKHAFAVLGREQLRRWLQVLLYVLDGSGSHSPLLELALRRARFMEYVLTYRTHHETSLLQDEAYMVGLLSLADALMGWPMDKVAERLHLAEELKIALVRRDRPLGHLITLCEALEQGDLDRVSQMAEDLQISEEGIMTAQNEAIAWAHRISHGAAESGREAETDSAPQQDQQDAAEEGGDQP